MTEERKLKEDVIDRELYNEAIERVNRDERKIYTAKEALELLEINEDDKTKSPNLTDSCKIGGFCFGGNFKMTEAISLKLNVR